MELILDWVGLGGVCLCKQNKEAATPVSLSLHSRLSSYSPVQTFGVGGWRGMRLAHGDLSPAKLCFQMVLPLSVAE